MSYLRYLQDTTGQGRFVQDGSYLPKQKNQTKDDWRRRKGFSKDQSKNRSWYKCRRYLKERGNRQNRRWINQLIHHERFDEIYFHQDMFVSSWDAC